MKKIIIVTILLIFPLLSFAQDSVTISNPEKSNVSKKVVWSQDCAMGYARIMSGLHKEAIPYLEKATQTNPNDAYAYSFLGIAYSSLGNYEEAIKHYEKAKELFLEQEDYEQVKAIENDLEKVKQKEQLQNKKS